MSHADMVRDGAIQYVQYLRALPLTRRVRAVADLIVETIENALRCEAALEITDVTFTFECLSQLTPDEKIYLYNPYLPGYGEPDARLVIVGTEHAFDFRRPRKRGPSPDACFAMADCALHALWLADRSESAAEIAEQISGQEPHGADIFAGHRHPYEFLYPIPAGHMWRRLSRMMGSAGFKLDPGAARMWGAAAYMFELSDTASGQQGSGALSSVLRQQFLPSIVASLEQALVLVFHGRWNDPEWNRIREPLAHAFLGSIGEPMKDPQWTLGSTEDYRSAISDDSSKLVVFMQSPTRRGPTNAFLDAVGELIAPYCFAAGAEGVSIEDVSADIQPAGIGHRPR